MRRRIAAALLAFVAVLVTTRSASADIQFVVCCFENPEVALWDPASHAWYVSSYGGYTLDQVNREGDGFISKLDKDGNDAGQGEFVEGLNSPYDMDVFKGKLFVADIRELVVIDVKSAKIDRKIKLGNKGGVLNGVAVDRANGDVYVSGWTDDTIYKVTGAARTKPKVSIFLRSHALETPNDMFIEKGRMVVTADGPGFFTSSYDPTQGRLLVVDMKTKKIKPLTDTFGVPDGIVKDGRDYITDDYITGRIIRVAPDGTMETISQHPPGTAQLGWDPKRRLMSVVQSPENVVIFETF
jgi:DNA-binding beta-propeller fold protein YncE